MSLLARIRGDGNKLRYHAQMVIHYWVCALARDLFLDFVKSTLEPNSHVCVRVCLLTHMHVRIGFMHKS